MSQSDRHVQSIGGVELWWVDRPAGPRTSLRAAAWVSVVVGVPLAFSLAWAASRNELHWPWQTLTPLEPSLAQLMVRYLALAAVGLLYVLLRSIPGWVRLAGQVRQDRRRVATRLADGDWYEAARLLHRSAHLRRELVGSVPLPAWCREADDAIRAHLRPRRRLYVHYRGPAPPLPTTPEAGFEPRIAPVSTASGWWIVPVVLVLTAATLADISVAARTGNLQVLLQPNFLLTAAVLAGFVTYEAAGLLGWRSYFRFAPGLVEVVRYRVLAGRPGIETIRLRDYDVLIDVTGWSLMLTLIDPGRQAVIRVYQLRKTPANVEACFRAALSTADLQETSRDGLVE